MDELIDNPIPPELLREFNSQRFALEHTGNYIWIWDVKSGEIQFVGNKANFLGYEFKHNKTPTDWWFSHIHTDDQLALNRKFKRLILGQDVLYQHSYRMRNNEGTLILLESEAVVYERCNDGKVKSVIGLEHINNEQKFITTEVTEYNEQLAFAMYSTRSSLFDYNIPNKTFKQLNFELIDNKVQQIERFGLISDGLNSVHPDDHKTNNSFFNGFHENPRELREMLWRSNYRDDQYRWQKAQGRVVSFDAKGNPLRAIGIRQDIHDTYSIEEEANAEKERNYQALKGTFHGVWDWNLKTGSVLISRNITETLVGELSNWTPTMNFWWSHIHPDDKASVSASIQAQIKANETQLITQYRIKSYDDSWVWLVSKGNIVERDMDNYPVRVLGTIIDITDQKLTEQALAHEKEMAQTTLESINEAVITTDKNGLITTINHKAEQLLALSNADIVDTSLSSLCSITEEGSLASTQNPVTLCLSSDLAFNLTKLTLTNISGKSFHIDCSVSPLHDTQHQIIGCVMVIRDVSRSRQVTQEIEHRAQHDALTGIYNRHAFEAELLKSTQSEDYEHILCYIDLDQFKIVNDTCGHIAGDELLRQLSAELSKKVRKSDTFARLGGDEFGILMLNCDIEQAVKISTSIKQTLTDYTFNWEDKSFTLGASFGLSIINPSISPTTAMQQADTACFSAKEQGRNRIHVYRPDDAAMSSAEGQMNWVPRIQQALKENQFILFAQAITDLQETSSAPTHFEVLIRLNSDGKTIPPGAFLPAAERYNLASQIDQWVIENTLQTLDSYKHKITAKDVFNINLSAASLCEPAFLSFIQTAFKSHNTTPAQICFEITETAAVTNLTAANTLITELKKMGCEFALDDFGSGLSSFGYLKNFPVDYLKIDGSFVKDIMHDPIDAAMVKSINEIGQIMGKKTVAEFVENQDIADALTTLGVNYAQGYHFSIPSPLIELLKDR